MRLFKHLTAITILVVLATFIYARLTAVPVWAQTEPTAELTGEQVEEGEESVQLAIHFLLRDNAGQPRTDANIQSASVLLADGTQSPATVSKPPFYIALVIDASGSMEEVFDDVKSSALELVNNAPSEIFFAVIRFDETIELVQPFTNNHADIVTAINEIEIEDDGTCLYDVALTAAQTLEQQLSPNNPRRAMVVFTDGRDELQQGFKDPCSQYTLDQVLEGASASQLPIHTISFNTEENNNEPNNNLSKLALVTGGLNSEENSQESRQQLIQQLLASIDSQWMASATLFPGRGVQRGSLLLTLGDGELPAPVPISFVTQKSYFEPEPPGAMEIINFRYDDVNDLFTFDVLLENLTDAATLQVETLNLDNNLQVDLANYNNPTTSYRVTLPASGLDPEQWYLTRVSTRTEDGRFIKDESGETISAEYEFRYDPPEIIAPLLLKIESLTIQDEPAEFNWRTFRTVDSPPELTVTLQLENAENVGSYIGQLINLTTNQISDEFEFTPAITGNTAVSNIPVSMEEGRFTFVVLALDGDNNRLATDHTQFIYTAPDGTIGRAGKAVQTNPILLLFLFLFIVFVTFFGWQIGHVTGRRQGSPGGSKGLDLSSLPDDSEDEEEAAQVVLRLESSPDSNLAAVGKWLLTDFPFTIGRDGCDLTIINDQHISRLHARITFVDGEYFIEDMGSSNGTFINATQIAPNERFVISADRGDTRIRVGKTTTFLFEEDRPEQNNAASNEQMNASAEQTGEIQPT